MFSFTSLAASKPRDPFDDISFAVLGERWPSMGVELADLDACSRRKTLSNSIIRSMASGSKKTCKGTIFTVYASSRSEEPMCSWAPIQGGDEQDDVLSFAFRCEKAGRVRQRLTPPERLSS
ncbi:MAG TPA: hypothetical protein VGO47_13130, partial [Chlamydiales bacterium]|nr:hypothetical protein [Chlamydiales bacterium]